MKREPDPPTDAFKRTMGRLYLHVYNGMGFVRDEEGEEFPSLEAARRRAIEGIRSIISDEAKHGSIDLRGRIEITEATGEARIVLPFREAFELHLNEEGLESQ